MTREEPSPTPEKSGSLTGLIAQAFFGLVLVVSLIVGVTLTFAPKPKTQDTLPALASTVLADGSTVSVVGVTIGPTHSLTFPRPVENGWDRFWGHRQFETIDAHSGDQGLMIWMTRRRAGSEALQVFEDLRGGWLELAPDRRLHHTNVHQYIRGQHGGSSGSSGTPPFSSTPHHPSDVVVTNLNFPSVADPKHPVTIRLLGEKGVELGSLEFTLPGGILPTAAPWSPKPIPQTVTRTFNGVKYELTLTSLDPREEPDGRVSLRPKLDMQVDGQTVPSLNYHIGMLKDPLGNQSGTYQVSLDRHSTVWELPATAYLRVDPAVDSTAEWTSPAMTMPATPAEAVTADANGELAGGRIQVHVSRFCGTKAPPLPLLPGAMGARGVGGWGYSTRVFNKELRVDFRDAGGTPALEVTTEFPYAYVDYAWTSATERVVLVTAHDDQSRTVKFEPFQHQGVNLYFFDTQPDTKSVTLVFGMEVIVEAAFRIAPPALPAAAPR